LVKDDPFGREDPGSPPALLSWSSGKDAAYTLYQLRRDRSLRIVSLLTAVTARTGRVSAHGVRGSLLRRQADATGLPLARVLLPPSPTNAVYERAMAATLRTFSQRGVRHVVFGDLFLEDVRQYRERQLSELGLKAVFPLWGRDTTQLARDMIDSGLEARLVSVDTRRLPASWAGRSFNRDLLATLPSGVDPCGENGEFHTFVTAGPIFRHPVPVRAKTIRVQDGVATADLEFRPPLTSRRGARVARSRSGTNDMSRSAPRRTGGSIG
jgi:uncharacterized protein (TIGR00290 family)